MQCQGKGCQFSAAMKSRFPISWQKTAYQAIGKKGESRRGAGKIR